MPANIYTKWYSYPSVSVDTGSRMLRFRVLRGKKNLCMLSTDVNFQTILSRQVGQLYWYWTHGCESWLLDCALNFHFLLKQCIYTMLLLLLCMYVCEWVCVWCVFVGTHWCQVRLWRSKFNLWEFTWVILEFVCLHCLHVFCIMLVSPSPLLIHRYDFVQSVVQVFPTGSYGWGSVLKVVGFGGS